MQQNTTDSKQGTYVQLHTWNPYESSDRCNPADGTVPVKVFTVRNLSDIRRSDIKRGYFGKNFHGCPTNMYMSLWSLAVYSSGHIWCNDSTHHSYFYFDAWGVELATVIGKALNMSLHISYVVEGKDTEIFVGIPFIFVGVISPIESTFDNYFEYTRTYLSPHTYLCYYCSTWIYFFIVQNSKTLSLCALVLM